MSTLITSNEFLVIVLCVCVTDCGEVSLCFKLNQSGRQPASHHNVLRSYSGLGAYNMEHTLYG